MTITTTIIINLISPFVFDLVPIITPSIQQLLPSKPDVNEYIATDKQEVLASWYGPGFDGNLTASGEVFNQYDLTVAHPYLAFNTRLRISYKGKSVIARVNDRGPFKHVKGEYFTEDRGIDLSKGTAQAIGFDGVSYVSVEVLQD